MRPVSDASCRKSLSAWVIVPWKLKDRYRGKTWAKVPNPEPKKGKSLRILNVSAQIIPLIFKLSGALKKRLITASMPIQIAQSRASPTTRIGVFENHFPFCRSLKRNASKLKERRRLMIPIRDAEKNSPRIIKIIPNPIRRFFPSRENMIWRQSAK